MDQRDNRFYRTAACTSLNKQLDLKDFMSTPQGELLCDTIGICVPPSFKKYLKKRIEEAYIAGWEKRDQGDGDWL